MERGFETHKQNPDRPPRLYSPDLPERPRLRERFISRALTARYRKAKNRPGAAGWAPGHR